MRTHLFTNLVGYARFLDERGDAEGARLFRAHRRVVGACFPNGPGVEVIERISDSFHVVFRDPSRAVRSSLAVMAAVELHNARHPDLPLRIRIGTHAGESMRHGHEYVGSTVVLAVRLVQRAHSGQILVSDTVRTLLRTTKLGPMRDLGMWRMAGIGEAVHVYELETFGGEALDPEVASVSERVLTTILFTDIVRSTERAAAMGDRGWRDLVERHHSLVRSELQRQRGQEVDTAGDGFFATFDSPSRAVTCAMAIRDGVQLLGLEIRAGVHVGECEMVAGKVGGIAVVAGSRVGGRAEANEVLVSQTVKDLVLGGAIRFADRGAHKLKGIPGEWRLYAAERGSASASTPSTP